MVETENYNIQNNEGEQYLKNDHDEKRTRIVMKMKKK